jgi:hypothetical protein
MAGKTLDSCPKPGDLPMTHSRISAVSTVAAFLFVVAASSFSLFAQQATAGNAAVPTLVQFSGVLAGSNGKPLTSISGVTFSLYAEQEGGAPLWLETQNVQPDKNGNYSVMLGSTTSQGLPASLFASGQARWLGVQPQGQEPQPRIMLLSVPYALKAGDAQTLNGQPASAFATASPGSAANGNGVNNNAITGSGTTDYVPLWLSKSKLGSSNIFQSAAGDLGIGTTSPAANLDVNGTSDIRNTLTLFPSTSSPTLSVNGTAFQVSSTGNVTFVSGQTFPGTGTVTSVGSGAGLTGGPITTSGTLSVATGGVTNAMLQNSSLTVKAGTALTGGGTVSLGNSTTLNVDTTKVPLLSGNNSFTGNQAVTGNLSDTGNISATGSITGQTGNFSANSTSPVVSITQSGSGLGLNVTAGNAAYGIEASSTTIGIIGNATTAGGYGVQGISTRGNGIGVAGATINGMAVVGNDTASSGESVGVYGNSVSANGYGVQGTSPNTGVSGIASGSGGYGVQGAGRYVGVSGSSSGSSGYGVQGTSPNVGVYGASDGSSQTGQLSFFPGVWGDTGGSFSNAPYAGVLGTADDGFAGWFENNSPSGQPALTAYADSTAGKGILGSALCCSNESGVVNYNVGVWGDTGEASGTASAVVGTADDNWAAHFYNNSATHTTLNAQNDTTTNTGLVFHTTGSAFNGSCTIDVQGDLHCTGSKSADVPVDGGARKVALYAVEAPDNWFEDAGSGQLSNGSARIDLDSTFAQTVNTGMNYHVFLTPNGDCKGLYVSQKSATSFEVHELGGGTSNIAFDYRIMAKRVGYESVRLADVTERYRQSAEELAQQRQNQGKHPMPQRPMRRPASPNPVAPPRPPLPVRAAVRPLNTENK